MDLKKPVALLLALWLLPVQPAQATFVTTMEDVPINRRIDRNTAKTLDHQPEAARMRTDTLVIGVPDLYGDVNPFFATTTGDGYAASLITDELLFANNDGKIGDGAARHALSADGKQVSFTLSDGVAYGDGTPVTSHDFINALYLLLTPGYDGPYHLHAAGITGVEAYESGEAGTISGIQAQSDTVFTVTWAGGSEADLAYLAIPALRVSAAGDMRRPGTMTDPADFAGFYADAVENARAADPAALAYGQYLPDTITLGKQASFTKNDAYWRGAPYIGTVELLVVTPGEELDAILSGSIDIVSMTGSVATVDQVVDFETGFINLYTWEGDVFGYLSLNLADPLFAEEGVRKALTMGFDRETAAKNAVERYGHVPTVLLFDAFSPGTAKVITEQYPYNPTLAANLLQEAGFTRGADGMLEKDGEPLTITLLHNRPNPLIDAYLMQLSIGYQDLGIRFIAEALPLHEVFTRVEAGDYQMAFQARRLPQSAALAADLFEGAALAAGEDSMLSRLLRMARAETDAARQTVIQELFFQELYMRLPIIPLYRRSEFVLANARVMNLTITTAHDITAGAYRLFLTDTLEGQW